MISSRSGRVLAVLALTCGLMTPGCAVFEPGTPEARNDLVHHHGTSQSLQPPRRVVFLQLDSEVGHPGFARDLGGALHSAFARRALFEIVPVSAADLADTEIKLTRERGIYRTEDLLKVSRRFGADGILHGVVTRFAPYPRVSIGLRLHLLDCRSGGVPWATDLLLDGNEARVAQDVHNYYDTVRHGDASLMDFEKILISPRLFSVYAADRVARTLESTFHTRSQVTASK